MSIVNASVSRTPLLVLLTLLAAACGGTDDTADTHDSGAPAAHAPPPSQLIPQGRLRVAIGVGSASSAFWATPDEATGEPHGVTVDLGRALEGYAGVPVDLIVYPNSGAITEAGPKGEWDVTFMLIDSARAAVVDFGPSYYRSDSAILVPAGSTLQTLADVNQAGIRVAAVDGTTTARSAAALLSNATLHYFGEVEAVLEAVRAGEVDGVALGRESLRSLLDELPGARVLDEGYNETGVAVAVPKGNAESLAYVSSFMDHALASGIVASALQAAGLQDTQPVTSTP